MKPIFTMAIAAGLLMGTAVSAQTLRIGLQEDPDVLDPHRARTFVGRIVFTSMCDKLVEITPELKFTPQLATEWKWSDDAKTLTMKLRPGVKFHDGETMNAAAVKVNSTALGHCRTACARVSSALSKASTSWTI